MINIPPKTEIEESISSDENEPKIFIQALDENKEPWLGTNPVPATLVTQAELGKLVFCLVAAWDIDVKDCVKLPFFAKVIGWAPGRTFTGTWPELKNTVKRGDRVTISINTRLLPL